MEKTIMELVSKSKFKSAKRHLKSSLITLNGMISNVFSTNDNIFKYFISSMRPRIKSLIKEAKTENNGEEILRKEKNVEECDNESTKQKQRRKRKKSLKANENECHQSSDFSSDDNLCLKDAVKRIKKDSTEECEIIKIESHDDCMKKNSYYVVPEKKNKTNLSVLEKDQIRIALKDTLKKKFVDLNLFDGYVLKRFELEFDEVIPDDAIVVTEWLFDDREKNDWDTISFVEFLAKNVSKKHKKSKSDFSHENGNRSLSKMAFNKSNNMEELMKTNSNIEDQYEKSNSKENDGKFKCNVCSSRFNSNNFLKVHMINIHHISDFRCDTCGEIFLYKGKLLQHQLQHHSLNLECEVCLIKCRSNEDKERHFISHGPERWCCGICSKSFLIGEDLKNHYKASHNTKNLTLFENMNEKINEESKASMKVVKYDKSSDDAPQCDKCFRRFTSVGRLTQHIAIAHEGKTFVRKKKQKMDESIVFEQSSSSDMKNSI